MSLKITRCPENPIVQPGLYDWRAAVVFNPAALYDEGRFYLYERAGSSLRPSRCVIGMLESDDGVHFQHTLDQPVLTPEMLGSKHGSVQDPRVVKIEDTYYMTFAFRPYAWNISPTGLGVPESSQPEFPGITVRDEDNQTRSGIAVSKDRRQWELLSWVNPTTVDDRNMILFPEKINGRYMLLRRPTSFVSTDTSHGAEHPTIRFSLSDDLKNWTEPQVLTTPQFAWEDNRIGASTPPIRTEHGWLLLYHGVQNVYPPTRRVVYRLGAMLLDLADPTRVIARCPHYIMEPETYYENCGLIIPHVIFPTGAVVKDGLLYIYYGACDTSIALATVPLEDLLAHVLKFPVD